MKLAGGGLFDSGGGVLRGQTMDVEERAI